MERDDDEEITQSQVCQTCKRIDFNALCEIDPAKRWPWRPHTSALLGTVRHLLDSQRRCDLCRTVVEALEDAHPTERLMDSEVLIGGYPFDGPNPWSIGSSGSELFRVVNLHVLVAHSHGPISVLHLQPTQYPISRATAQTLGDNGRWGGKRGRLLAYDDERAGLYKGWLLQCETEHHLCEKFDRSISTASGDINLVDVETGRVVPKRTTDDHYVALSYVWGSRVHLKLSSTNSDHFMRHGIEGNIPKTIREAMTVVHRMGIRYLWVDALCIVQDDDAHKTTQVSQMAAIYAKAAFVIVAAAGQDAHSGLSPGRAKSIGKQRPLHIGRATFLTILNEDIVTGNTKFKLPSAPSKADWTNRAWTLQEILFARRALVFRRDQVYWHCKESMFYEESATETVHPIPDNVATTSTGHQDYTGAVVLDRRFRGIEIAVPSLCTLIEDFGYLAASGHAACFPLLVYDCLVREYSRRFMSDRNDISMAFAGVMKALQHQHPYQGDGWPGLQLVWSLSTHEPGWALAWEAVNLIDYSREKRLRARRELKSGRSRGTIDIPPSWSWLAWYGDAERKIPISVGGFSVDRFAGIVPCQEEIAFSITTTDRTLCRLQPQSRHSTPTYSGYGTFPEENCLSKPEYGAVDWKEGPTHVPDENNKEMEAAKIPGLLLFYTSTATLPVLRWKTAGAHEYDLPAADYFQQFCKETVQPCVPCYCGRKRIGILRMGSTDHISMYEHERMGWISSEYRQKIRGSNSPFQKEAKEGDFLMFDFCIISRSSGEKGMLNVLIVEWIDGIAYRVGIAFIEEDAWVHVLNRRWRLIKLS